MLLKNSQVDFIILDSWNKTEGNYRIVITNKKGDSINDPLVVNKLPFTDDGDIPRGVH